MDSNQTTPMLCSTVRKRRTMCVQYARKLRASCAQHVRSRCARVCNAVQVRAMPKYQRATSVQMCAASYMSCIMTISLFEVQCSQRSSRCIRSVISAGVYYYFGYLTRLAPASRLALIFDRLPHLNLQALLMYVYVTLSQETCDRQRNVIASLRFSYPLSRYDLSDLDLIYEASLEWRTFVYLFQAPTSSLCLVTIPIYCVSDFRVHTRQFYYFPRKFRLEA